MKQRKIILGITLALTILALLGGVSALAKTDAGYSLEKYTFSGGVYHWNGGGGYSLGGSLGQSNTSHATGGGFDLTGGFWQPAGDLNLVYLPLILH